MFFASALELDNRREKLQGIFESLGYSGGFGLVQDCNEVSEGGKLCSEICECQLTSFLRTASPSVAVDDRPTIRSGSDGLYIR